MFGADILVLSRCNVFRKQEMWIDSCIMCVQEIEHETFVFAVMGSDFPL